METPPTQHLDSGPPSHPQPTSLLFTPPEPLPGSNNYMVLSDLDAFASMNPMSVSALLNDPDSSIELTRLNYPIQGMQFDPNEQLSIQAQMQGQSYIPITETGGALYETTADLTRSRSNTWPLQPPQFMSLPVAPVAVGHSMLQQLTECSDADEAEAEGRDATLINSNSESGAPYSASPYVQLQSQVQGQAGISGYPQTMYSVHATQDYNFKYSPSQDRNATPTQFSPDPSAQSSAVLQSPALAAELSAPSPLPDLSLASLGPVGRHYLPNAPRGSLPTTLSGQSAQNAVSAQGMKTLSSQMHALGGAGGSGHSIPLYQQQQQQQLQQQQFQLQMQQQALERGNPASTGLVHPGPLTLSTTQAGGSRSRDSNSPPSAGGGNTNGVHSSPSGHSANSGGSRGATDANANANGNGGSRQKPARRNAWGNQSYADLITQAIEQSSEKRLTLAQIYDWMVQNVPYFRDKGDMNSSAGWKNSIRHNLSLHSKFIRVQNENTGKSSWWMINPDLKKTATRPELDEIHVPPPVPPGAPGMGSSSSSPQATGPAPMPVPGTFQLVPGQNAAEIIGRLGSTPSGAGTTQDELTMQGLQQLHALQVVSPRERRRATTMDTNEYEQKRNRARRIAKQLGALRATPSQVGSTATLSTTIPEGGPSQELDQQAQYPDVHGSHASILSYESTDGVGVGIANKLRIQCASPNPPLHNQAGPFSGSAVQVPVHMSPYSLVAPAHSHGIGGISNSLSPRFFVQQPQIQALIQSNHQSPLSDQSSPVTHPQPHTPQSPLTSQSIGGPGQQQQQQQQHQIQKTSALLSAFVYRNSLAGSQISEASELDQGQPQAPPFHPQPNHTHSHSPLAYQVQAIHGMPAGQTLEENPPPPYFSAVGGGQGYGEINANNQTQNLGLGYPVSKSAAVKIENAATRLSQYGSGQILEEPQQQTNLLQAALLQQQQQQQQHIHHQQQQQQQQQQQPKSQLYGQPVLQGQAHLASQAVYTGASMQAGHAQNYYAKPPVLMAPLAPAPGPTSLLNQKNEAYSLAMQQRAMASQAAGQGQAGSSFAPQIGGKLGPVSVPASNNYQLQVQTQTSSGTAQGQLRPGPTPLLTNLLSTSPSSSYAHLQEKVGGPLLDIKPLINHPGLSDQSAFVSNLNRSHPNLLQASEQVSPSVGVIHRQPSPVGTLTGSSSNLQDVKPNVEQFSFQMQQTLANGAPAASVPGSSPQQANYLRSALLRPNANGNATQSGSGMNMNMINSSLAGPGQPGLTNTQVREFRMQQQQQLQYAHVQAQGNAAVQIQPGLQISSTSAQQRSPTQLSAQAALNYPQSSQVLNANQLEESVNAAQAPPNTTAPTEEERKSSTCSSIGAFELNSLDAVEFLDPLASASNSARSLLANLSSDAIGFSAPMANLMSSGGFVPGQMSSRVENPPMPTTTSTMGTWKYE